MINNDTIPVENQVDSLIDSIALDAQQTVETILPDTEMFNWELSNRAVFIFLLLGLAVFFTFRVLKFLSPKLLKRKRYQQLFNNLLPIIELFTWVLFFIWAVEFFMTRHFLLAFVVFILLMLTVYWLFRFAIKDFVAGIVFKSGGNFNLNENVEIGNFTGKITKFGLRSLILETEKGKTICLPYSLVLQQVSIKSHLAETIASHTFRLKTAKKHSLDKTVDEIRTSIFNLPWSSIKKSPQVKLISEDDKFFYFDITVYSVEQEYFYKIENQLKERFDK